MPSPGRRFKNAIYEQFGRVAKALASPHRIELVELLAQGPRTVEALGRMADMSLANTSAHLQVLRTAGLVEATKQGLFVTYRLADRSVADLLLALRKVAETRLAEVSKITRDFLAENALLEPEMARVLRPGGRLVVGELGRLSIWAAWRRVRTWLGSTTWRRAPFFTSRELKGLAEGAGLVPGRVRGAVFYPPAGLAASVLAPLDQLLGRVTTVGAAFVALAAEKPGVPAGS